MTGETRLDPLEWPWLYPSHPIFPRILKGDPPPDLWFILREIMDEQAKRKFAAQVMQTHLEMEQVQLDAEKRVGEIRVAGMKKVVEQLSLSPR